VLPPRRDTSALARSTLATSTDARAGEPAADRWTRRSAYGMTLNTRRLRAWGVGKVRGALERRVWGADAEAGGAWRTRTGARWRGVGARGATRRRARSGMDLLWCVPVALCFSQNFSTKVH
jgi:hypothetical protein